MAELLRTLHLPRLDESRSLGILQIISDKHVFRLSEVTSGGSEVQKDNLGENGVILTI